MTDALEGPSTLLVVDDDEVFRSRLVRALQARGFEVWSANGPPEALTIAREHAPELALVDLRMPDGSGLDLVRDLLALEPCTNVVVLTGYGSIATALEAVRRGATHYLTKPADVAEILAAFARKDLPAEADPPEVQIEAPSLARMEWERQHQPRRGAARAPPALAATQALEVPGAALSVP